MNHLQWSEKGHTGDDIAYN